MFRFKKTLYFITNKLVIRSVSTKWSSLAIAFNTKPKKKFLKNIGCKNVGLFNIPQLIDHNGYHLLKQSVLSETESLVEEASSPSRKRLIVKVFDDLSDSLCRLADMADFIRVAHPDDNYKHSAEDACSSISLLVEHLNTNQLLYESLRKVAEGKDIMKMDDIDKRVVDLFLFDFKLSGIHLGDKERKEFVCLNNQIHKLGSSFLENCYQSSSISRSMLPEKLQKVFSWNGDTVRVSNLHSDNPNGLVREAAYKIFLHPNQNQAQRLNSLLKCRHKMAKLAGFESFGHRALQGTMFQSPQKVESFLLTLMDSVKERSEKDLALLGDLKNITEGNRNLNPWDIVYYSSMARSQNTTSNLISNYLPLGACMEGLSNLFNNLYDVTLEYVGPDHGEVWCTDIYKLAVKNNQKDLLGYIYCDFFERYGKPYQDCHFTIQGGRVKANGDYQIPKVVLMLNLQPPTSKHPTLLSTSSMENLFHEFGHAMHSILGSTRYQHVTGTRCSTDFAEVPSVLMEYFAQDPRVLKTFAKHWNTGEPLPDELASLIVKNKTLLAGCEAHLQIFYALVDHHLHSSLINKVPMEEIINNLQDKYFYHKPVSNTTWYLRFGHFVGYGAKYYSYLASRSIASKIWNRFFQDDPFNRKMGSKFRDEVLRYGGEIQPTTLLENYFGEKINFDKLSDSLIGEWINS